MAVYQPTLALSALTGSLFKIEFFREGVTLVMIFAVAMLAATDSQRLGAIFMGVCCLGHYLLSWFVAHH